MLLVGGAGRGLRAFHFAEQNSGLHGLAGAMDDSLILVLPEAKAELPSFIRLIPQPHEQTSFTGAHDTASQDESV